MFFNLRYLINLIRGKKTEMKITTSFLKDNQYYKETTKKFGIVIHHTAGGPNPINVITGWNANEERVATAFIIAGKSTSPNYKDGEIFQTFDTNHWAHHLGIKSTQLPKGSLTNTALNQGTIAIELCNWGGLTKDAQGNFRTYVNTIIPFDEVIEYEKPFKGYKFYHKYTDEQLVSLNSLLVYLCEKYKIPKTYHTDMWDISKEAMKGNPGIYTHVSYRTDKSDCHPYPELINLLQNLSQ